MKTIQFKGIIDYDNNEGTGIYLLGDTDRIDLVTEFEDFNGVEIQVNYWITNKPCTKDEMIEAWLKVLFGSVEAEYEDYYTGSWTYGCQSSWGCYEKHGQLTIGGHDLFDELSNMDGKFIIIEVNIQQSNDTN